MARRESIWVVCWTLFLCTASAAIVANARDPADAASPAARAHLWLDGFTGMVRVWRCTWSLDRESVCAPRTIAIFVTEFRLVDQGYEELGIKWVPPLRRDLTPDVSYSRHTPEALVVATGSDERGAWASILKSSDFALEETALFGFATDPVAPAFAEFGLSKAVVELPWKPAGQADHRILLEDAKNTMQSQQVANMPATCFHGESRTLGALSRRIESDVICIPSLLAADGSRSLDGKGGSPRLAAGELCAIDARIEDSYDTKPEWDGITETSYRVLEWQRPALLETSSPKLPRYVPRLAVWEEICKRPRQPNKDYHRMGLMLIDIEASAAKQLTSDWDQMLPGMRISDVTSGKARKSTASSRECIAWDRIVAISDASAKFEELVRLDLRNRYPSHFVPVARMMPDQGVAAREIGAMRHGSVFQALKGQPVKKPAGADQLAPAQQGTALPKILELVGEVYSAGIPDRAGPEKPPLEHTGFKLVTEERRLSATRSLIVLLTSVGASGAAILVLFFFWRRRALHKVRRTEVLAYSAVFFLAGMPFLAHGEAPETARAVDAKTLWNVDEVRDALALHCDTINTAFPDVKMEPLWRSLIADHLEVRQRLESSGTITAANTDVVFARKMIRALEGHYADVRWNGLPGNELSDAKSGGLAKGHSLSTLKSVLVLKKANCYSLCYLYLLHCRLANSPMHMLATPEHVMLCCGGPATGAANDAIGFTDVYDAVRKQWLTDRAARHVRGAPHHILDHSQIAAACAFNLGTELSRQGELDQGAQLLEKSLRLRFPFPHVIQNLCRAYYDKKRYVDVIDLVENKSRKCDAGFSRWLSSSPTWPSRLERVGATESEILDAYRDIAKLYFYALVRVGRDDDARATAEHLLTDAKTVDYSLYRAYLDLKTPGEASPSSASYLPRVGDALSK